MPIFFHFLKMEKVRLQSLFVQDKANGSMALDIVQAFVKPIVSGELL